MDTADVIQWSPEAVDSAPGPVSSRIEELRRRIAAGDYITPEKIEVVVDRLHEKLRRERLTGADEQST